MAPKRKINETYSEDINYLLQEIVSLAGGGNHYVEIREQIVDIGEKLFKEGGVKKMFEVYLTIRPELQPKLFTYWKAIDNWW